MILLAIQIAFVFFVAFAAASDYRSLRIPNWISLALCALFALYAAYLPDWPTRGWHVVIGGGVFAAAVLSYAYGVFGGGDVKLLGALALWAGPEHIVEFLMFTGLLGGAFGLIILRVRKIVETYPTLVDRPGAVWNIARWAHHGTCPYGIPIAIAALLSLPAIFVV